MRWIRRRTPKYARPQDIARRLVEVGRACGHAAYRYLQVRYEPTIHDQWIGLGAIVAYHAAIFIAGAVIF